MIIRGSLYADLVLIPNGYEYRPMARVFDGQIKRARDGYTLSAYDKAVDMVVAGSPYFETVALKTRSYDNKQSMLTDFNRVINMGNNEIINSLLGVRLPKGSDIKFGKRGASFNHIPQLMTILTDGRVLSGFNGTYDFDTKTFWGQVDFIKISQICNV